MDSTGTYREPFLAKIRSDGNWVWVRNGAQASDAYFSHIEEEPSGKLVIAGMTTAFALGAEDMYCTTFSSDGWFSDGNVIGGYMDDYSTMHSFYEFDSTYLAIGTTKSFHTPMSGIILVQMNDTMHYDTTTRMVVVSALKNIKQQPLIVDVYPNPVSELISLRFDSPVSEKAIIRIIDINGKVVISRKISELSGIRKFDLSPLTKGIYILNLESKSYNFNKKITKL
jgi:hypothetical protein